MNGFLAGAGVALFITSTTIGLWTHFSVETKGWGWILFLSVLLLVAAIGVED